MEFYSQEVKQHITDKKLKKIIEGKQKTVTADGIRYKIYFDSEFSIATPVRRKDGGAGFSGHYGGFWYIHASDREQRAIEIAYLVDRELYRHGL